MTRRAWTDEEREAEASERTALAPLRVRDLVYSTPWAILPEKLRAIVEVVEMRARGMTLSDAEIAARTGTSKPPIRNVRGSIAIVPVFGTISRRMTLFQRASGGASTEGITRAFRALLADDQIGAIVLDVDSPGGTVPGSDELSEEIFRARGKKPIVAVADTTMASAALWIASAADEIVAAPSAEVGSIGVFAIHVDQSKAIEAAGLDVSIISGGGKFKVEGNPFEPLDDDARAEIQRKVNASADVFIRRVAKNRGVSAKTVRNDFGQGRMLRAPEALEVGMIDRIETFDQTISRLAGRKGVASAGVSEAAHRDRIDALEEIETSIGNHAELGGIIGNGNIVPDLAEDGDGSIETSSPENDLDGAKREDGEIARETRRKKIAALRRRVEVDLL